MLALALTPAFAIPLVRIICVPLEVFVVAYHVVLEFQCKGVWHAIICDLMPELLDDEIKKNQAAWYAAYKTVAWQTLSEHIRTDFRTNKLPTRGLVYNARPQLLTELGFSRMGVQSPLVGTTSHLPSVICSSKNAKANITSQQFVTSLINFPNGPSAGV